MSSRTWHSRGISARSSTTRKSPGARAPLRTIVTTHQHVAESYLSDGTIVLAVPPIRALLEIMATGHSADGLTLHDPRFRAMFDRANTMTGVISLGIGEPDMPTPKLVCEAAKEALDKGITHYTPNAGTLAFRQAIAEKSYLKELHYDPNTEIIITNGGMGALSLLGVSAFGAIAG